ncbi:MAG: cupin domain-containing protein [Paramuribaculum sp.]|nr:cupin domain-containing protein [Paramuribaculum sp.]
MNDINILDRGARYIHASVGNLSEFEGKKFLKEATGATSCEISFGTLPSGASVPFFHSHRANEENYIILSGKGRFQIDDEVFDIAEGSIVRVATGCDRNLRCTSCEPLTYICIQAKENSLTDYTASDADITQRPSQL